MPGFDYRLAQSGEVLVAGLAPTSDMPHWLICFAVDDCAATCRAMQADGAKLLAGPDEVPGTGHYAVLADPQGAYFGLLQPDLSAITPEEIAKAEASGAFDPQTPGHGHWHELMSSDPAAGLAFYAKHFGWAEGAVMDMGDMGSYQLFRHDGADIGGIMGLAGAPGSYWLPYLV